jgi:malonyl-CoA O-methyltransferase
MNRPRAEHALPDKRAVRRVFDNAAAFETACAVHDEARQRLLERLELFRLAPRTVVDLGCGTGRSLPQLAARYPAARTLGVDASLGMLRAVHRHGASGERTSLLAADAEALPLRDGSVQLLFANLCLPFCRPDRVFSEAARVLEAGGLFAFSTVGPDTLRELRQAWRGADDRIHVHAAFDMHDLGDLALRSGLAEPVLDVDRLDVTYEDLDCLVRELRDCGAVNTAAGRRRELTGPARWRAFEARLAAERGTGERLRVTVELVSGQAWGRGPIVTEPRDVGPTEVAVPVERIGRRGPG